MTQGDLQDLVRDVSNSEISGYKPTSFINVITKDYLFPIAGFALFIYLIIGGYQIMFSGGDPKAVETGKGKITTALIGFIIIFVSYWIVQAISIAFGLKSVGEIF